MFFKTRFKKDTETQKFNGIFIESTIENQLNSNKQIFDFLAENYGKIKRNIK
jgi:hypothetical protein